MITKKEIAAIPSPPALSGEAEEVANALRHIPSLVTGVRDVASFDTMRNTLRKAASLIERQAREIAELKQQSVRETVGTPMETSPYDNRLESSNVIERMQAEIDALRTAYVALNSGSDGEVGRLKRRLADAEASYQGQLRNTHAYMRELAEARAAVGIGLDAPHL